MAATALIKFTQGASVGNAGEAMKGTLSTGVTIENGDNSGVASWQIDLLYIDPVSSLVASTPYAFNNSSSTPSASFTPDARGSYRWRLKVWDVPGRAGNPADTDIRVFSVPEAHGLVVPPPQIWPIPLPQPESLLTGAKPHEMNFAGQEDGWAGNGADDGLMGEVIRRVDGSHLANIKVPGLAGAVTTNLTGPLSVGSIVLDPTNYPTGATFKFEAVMSTEATLAVATLRLYNLTDGEVVSGSTITTNSLTLARVESAALTVGASSGNLKNSLKMYEIQLYRAGGGSDDFVDVHLAQIAIYTS